MNSDPIRSAGPGASRANTLTTPAAASSALTTGSAIISTPVTTGASSDAPLADLLVQRSIWLRMRARALSGKMNESLS